MNRADALARIVEAVGPEGIVEGAAADALLVDERRLYRGEAALVARPRDTAQCAEVIALCSAAGIGVVPQGGNTGYCGGATPTDGANQILLSLSRMNRIREVDAVGFTITVEAGVVLARAQQAAAEAGLLLPLSMGSEGSCQIGGNLATNAGGLAVLRYGMARDLALGLEVVLPNGEVLSELKGLRKDNTGYDLISLFVGAEGTLGVITAAVLKLFPQPRSVQTAWLAVPSPNAACELLGLARAQSGDQVVSAEYVSGASLALVLEFVEGARAPFSAEHAHHVLLELASGDDEPVLRQTLERLLETGLAAGSIDDGVIAESGAQRRALWALRERIPEAERADGASIKHDISVRIARIPEFLAKAESALASMDHRLSVFGHIGDGNLHFNVLPPAGQSIAGFRLRHEREISERVHGLAAELGGSFSAEHGVGRLKRAELERYGSRESLAIMRALKHALDPQGIMNPGKLLSER